MQAFIDIHTHNKLSTNPFSILNVSISEAITTCTISEQTFFSLGIHPWDVHKTDSAILNDFDRFATNRHWKGVGECGLDRNATATFREQMFFFERQIAISEKYCKPLIIHCVSAFNEVILLKKKHKPEQNWIIHGFRGKPALALELVKHGFALSFGEKFNSLSVAATPIELLCLETDTSAFDIETLYRNIATIKNCSPESLCAACSLFKLYVC
ncbi:MAG: hypothetical protein AUK44_09080 [Porphyromonadaceae bacterium CG2_30_38_12]|nr:MAG: hypothetical protein AUK44_09080 [Porphyromonadaceae bacterium CG2_30_38_12]